MEYGLRSKINKTKPEGLDHDARKLEIKRQLISELNAQIDRAKQHVGSRLLDGKHYGFSKAVDTEGHSIKGILGVNLNRLQMEQGYKGSTWFTSEEMERRELRAKTGEEPHKLIVIKDVMVPDTQRKKGQTKEKCLVRTSFYNFDQIERSGEGWIEWQSPNGARNDSLKFANAVESVFDVYKDIYGFEREDISDQRNALETCAGRAYSDHKEKLWDAININMASISKQLAASKGIDNPNALIVAHYQIAELTRTKHYIGEVQEQFEATIGGSMAAFSKLNATDFLAAYNAGSLIARDVKRTLGNVMNIGVEETVKMKRLDAAATISAQDSEALRTLESILAERKIQASATISRDLDAASPNYGKVKVKFDGSGASYGDQASALLNMHLEGLSSMSDIECVMRNKLTEKAVLNLLKGPSGK